MATRLRSLSTVSRRANLAAQLNQAQGPQERDLALHGLVQLYREGQDPAIWELLLVALQSTLKWRLRHFRIQRPLYNTHDIAQELALAVRETALTIPLERSAYFERRLALRAFNRVARLLKKERRRQDRQDSLEVLREEEDQDEIEES